MGAVKKSPGFTRRLSPEVRNHSSRLSLLAPLQSARNTRHRHSLSKLRGKVSGDERIVVKMTVKKVSGGGDSGGCDSGGVVEVIVEDVTVEV